MSYPRVEIDLNDSDENGQTIAFLADSDAPLHVGRMVTAFEPEDEVSAPAMVARIDEVNGVAFLWVDWKSMAKDVPYADSFRLSRAMKSNGTSRAIERGLGTRRSANSTSLRLSVTST